MIHTHIICIYIIYIYIYNICIYIHISVCSGGSAMYQPGGGFGPAAPGLHLRRRDQRGAGAGPGLGELGTAWIYRSLGNWLVVSNIFYFPFHIWDVILPIDEFISFKMVKTTNQDKIGVSTMGNQMIRVGFKWIQTLFFDMFMVCSLDQGLFVS